MDKLTVEEAQLIADHRDTLYDEETRALHFVTRKDMAQQLLDTMRENERLKLALDVATGVDHLINPNKHTDKLTPHDMSLPGTVSFGPMSGDATQNTETCVVCGKPSTGECSETGSGKHYAKWSPNLLGTKTPGNDD